MSSGCRVEHEKGRLSPRNRSVRFRGACHPARHFGRDPLAQSRLQSRGFGGMELTTMPQHPEAIIAGKQRPFTGAEFLESLRDGREVFIYGERVKDVTTHPAFRNAAASIPLLYDALHDAKTRDVLTAPTDTVSGGYTHKFFQ